mmetsp:Transcript_36213/g.57909  ORF Transcript_36213/g.57909 Transcript_36213/m.57909 type:complete len:150 (+) Transcript_36213:27-476(+)
MNVICIILLPFFGALHTHAARLNVQSRKVQHQKQETVHSGSSVLAELEMKERSVTPTIDHKSEPQECDGGDDCSHRAKKPATWKKLLVLIGLILLGICAISAFYHCMARALHSTKSGEPRGGKFAVDGVPSMRSERPGENSFSWHMTNK